MIDFIVNKTKSFLYKALIKPKTKIILNSYSQAGEDRIVHFLFSSVGNHRPTYLDVGGYFPDHLSNTYLFYLNGSRGVCVEADESLIPLLQEKRKDDTILNIGVGIADIRNANFYIFSEKGLNTFSKQEAENRASRGPFQLVKISEVQLRPINSIIEENFNSYPDFLTIDIEGLDLDVLKTLDLNRFPIPVICAETCKYSENHIKPKDNTIIDYMLSQGYFIYADTYINTIFVNENWFSKTN